MKDPGRLARAWGWPLMLAGLAACGGGGGSPANAPLAVTIDTAEVVASFLAGDPSGSLVTAEVLGHYNGSASTVYALVSPTGNAFYGGTASIGLLPNNAFRVQLSPNTTLPAGTYTGRLAVQVCGDPSCLRSYAVTPASVPYTVTISPAITLGAAVNGVTNPLAVGPGTLRINDGDVLTLTASEPVVWTTMFDDVNATAVTQTATTWSATLTGQFNSSFRTSRIQASRATGPAGGAVFQFTVQR